MCLTRALGCIDTLEGKVLRHASDMPVDMAKPFRIYAAPRGADGRYGFADGLPVYVKEFATHRSMLRHWNDILLPATSTDFGLKFELSMVEVKDSCWEFIGDPRYADTPVLKGRKIADFFERNR